MIRTLIRPVVLLILFPLISGGCTVLGLVPAGYTPLPVLDPSTFGSSMQFRQKISVKRSGPPRTFDAAVEIRPDRMVIIGFAGPTRLFTIKVTPDSFQVETDQETSIPFKRLAADLQWSLWKSLPDRPGYHVREQRVNGTLRRTIFRNGDRVATVDLNELPPWSGTVEYRNTAGYSIRIRTAEAQSLETSPAD